MIKSSFSVYVCLPGALVFSQLPLLVKIIFGHFFCIIPPPLLLLCDTADKIWNIFLEL